MLQATLQAINAQVIDIVKSQWMVDAKGTSI